jgi:3-deoxy-manno-octulosonate cytidylyltransferase (CMP-KDO synthetase)
MNGNMKSIIIIPARMGSTRFPGKPLKKINGVPMIKIIYDNIKSNRFITDILVATCDKQICDFCALNNMKFIRTSATHKRASDRTAEAVLKYEKKYKKKIDIVVMVQGDEPMVDNHMIAASIKPFIKNKNIQVVNLISKIRDKNVFYDKNCIKVVKNKDNEAIYFSRSPIPNNINKKLFFGYKQVCIIPFRRNFLFKYLAMKETNLEKIESVDMLRILENGYNVKLVEIKKNTYPVDTLKDLRKVSKILNSR